MSWNLRTGLLLTLLGILTALVLPDSSVPEARAQVQKNFANRDKAFILPPAVLNQGAANQPRFDFNPPSQTLILPTDPNLKKKFDAIPDYIKEELWSETVKSLQSLLETREDVFVPLAQKIGDDRQVIEWRSVRTEANRLLGSLPRPALEFYEVAFGQQAKAGLKEAQNRNDAHLMAQVAQRYFYTEAGAEATGLLGNYHLDRGRYFNAALCFEKYVQRVGLDKLSPLDLYRATLAFHRAGEKANADRTWKRLTEKAEDGIRLGERKVALAELEKALGKPGEGNFAQGPVREWHLFRGSPLRFAQGQGNAPANEVRWSQALFKDSTAQSWVLEAVAKQEARNQAVLSGSFPVATGGRIVYRSPRGIQALEAETGTPLWESSSDWSLEQSLRESEHSHYITQWAQAHLQISPNALLENSVLGSLSTNGSLVFAVDDLALPPLPNHYQGFVGKQALGLKLAFAPEMTDAVYHNRLRALDLETGKLAWELGQRREEGPGKIEIESPLENAYFLGPPLPLAGRLYALTEKNQDLRLICLDPQRGDIVWTQLLATVQKKLLIDSSRRVHAVPIACAEGILVCPTNAGALIAVDLLTHSLVWAHLYREEPKVEAPKPNPGAGRVPARQPATPPKPPTCDAEWRGAAPMIHNGKVIYGAPDAPGIHCLNLRDGRHRWTFESTEPHLYAAGIFQEKVVLVNKQSVRALNLDNGREVWKVDVGQPSGHGVASGNLYYLPVKLDSQTQTPAICAVDLDRGVVVSRTPAPKGEVLGNLFFYDGKVFSQTPTTLTAYPQAKGSPE